MASWRLLSAAWKTALSAAKPPPKLTLSEWSNRFAYLPDTSAKPGRFSTRTTGIQRGVLDAISDPKTHTVVWQSSSQTGKTQTLLNAIGYFADQDPSSILVVQPTVDDAKDFSKERLAAFIRATPRLRVKFSAAKSRDQGNTLLHKEFAGGNITLAGANAPSRLASRPKRIIFADEVDRYPISAGTEGDPIQLALKRSLTFWNRKAVLASTPGNAGSSRIEAAYEEGDGRQFWVPCPHCQHAQVLAWPQVHWSKGLAGEHLPETAAYACIECGSLWTDSDRWRAVRTAEDKGGGWRARRPFQGIASFHSSELYSTFVELQKTVRDFLAAAGNAERMKVWTNTSLGETWAERGEAPDWQRLYERREKDLALGDAPEWAGMLTVGADVQRDRIEADVWAWGPGLESALVDHLVVHGDPAGEAVWAEMDALLLREWETPRGRSLRPARFAIDTGDGYSTTQVYAWARRHPRAVMAIKGTGKFDASSPVSGPTWVDVTVRGRKMKRGVQLWSVAVGVFKAETYSFLSLPLPLDGQPYPAGSIHLPQGVDDEWIQQLVGEQLVTVKKRSGFSRLEWQKVRARNEAIDMRVYARAAAYALGIDRWTDKHWSRARGEMTLPKSVPAAVVIAAVATVAAPAPARAPKVNKFTGRAGGFLQRR
ncbi:MAG: phage terminase large subunit family protein [Janthinobacterium lividum]